MSNFWDEEQCTRAIIDVQNSQDLRERDKIFQRDLYIPLIKMTNALIGLARKHNKKGREKLMSIDPHDVLAEAWIYGHKNYSPKKGRSFSYFSQIIRNAIYQRVYRQPGTQDLELLESQMNFPHSEIDRGQTMIEKKAGPDLLIWLEEERHPDPLLKSKAAWEQLKKWRPEPGELPHKLMRMRYDRFCRALEQVKSALVYMHEHADDIKFFVDTGNTSRQLKRRSNSNRHLLISLLSEMTGVERKHVSAVLLAIQARFKFPNTMSVVRAIHYERDRAERAAGDASRCPESSSMDGDGPPSA